MKAHVRDLGQRIADRRRAVGLTQEQLAEKAGVNVKSVQGAEQGRTEPELRTMRKLARALGTPLDVLAGGAGARSADAQIRRIEADLRRCSRPLLEHVAAIVSALAKGAKP